MSEDGAVPLMQFPLLVRAIIWNLAMVLAIAHLLFVKDTMRSLTATNKCWQMGQMFD